MNKILIIGGSDGGISAALRAQELDTQAKIRVLLADEFPNYSICGLPFYLSGETPEWRKLAHRTEFAGIEVLPKHRVRLIDPENKHVVIAQRESHRLIPYDRLIIATGATPAEPPIAGLTTPGVHLLHTMDDGFKVNAHLSERAPKSALIVGAGYIGLEMADALRRRGLEVTIVSRPQNVLPAVDKQFGMLVQQELERHAVNVWTRTEVAAIEDHGTGLSIRFTNGETRTAELVIVATGVRPASELAAGAGLRTGRNGAILVNQRMEASVPDIFAAGDCVETWHRVLNAYTYLPLGTTSHRQGRVAGENAAGGSAIFKGSAGTQVVKVFELAIARTGLLDSEARSAGFDPFTIEHAAWDHKAYCPGARELHLRLTGDRQSGRLLGAQLIGHWKSEIAKRIDTFATALFHEMKIEELNDLDLSYTPPLGSPWDPAQMAAQAWVKSARAEQENLETANV